MNLLETYTKLSYGNKGKKHIFNNHIEQILNKNNIIFELDDLGDIIFPFGYIKSCIVYDQFFYGLIQKESGSWKVIGQGLDEVVKFFKLNIPDELLERFIFELT